MVATSNHLHSAYKPTAQDLGLLPMNEAIDKVVANTATVLTRPNGYSILVMQAEAGDWQLKPGDYEGAFPDDASLTETTADTTAGNAVWVLAEGKEMAIAAPDEITVQGADSNSVLRYYWV